MNIVLISKDAIKELNSAMKNEEKLKEKILKLSLFPFTKNKIKKIKNKEFYILELENYAIVFQYLFGVVKILKIIGKSSIE